MKSIIYWGATGQAKVLQEFSTSIGFDLVALFDNNRDVTSPFANVPIFHGEAEFERWLTTKNETIFGLVAIGGEKGEARLKIQKLFADKGVKIVTAVHPAAYAASNAVISEGCQILAHSTVGTEAVLGKACIINTSASVDHECILGDGVHIGPGATLAGEVEVGEFTFVGAGAVVLPRVKIGSNVVVGAGAVVTKDIKNGVIVYGNPATYVRNNFGSELPRRD